MLCASSMHCQDLRQTWPTVVRAQPGALLARKFPYHPSNATLVRTIDLTMKQEGWNIYHMSVQDSCRVQVDIISTPYCDKRTKRVCDRVQASPIPIIPPVALLSGSKCAMGHDVHLVGGIVRVPAGSHKMILWEHG